jgi:hypothetical protein
MEDKLPADELEVSAGESVQPHTLLHGPTLFSHDARRILPSTSTQSWIPSHDIESGTSNARHSVFAPGPPWIDHEFDGLAQHSSQTYDYHFRSDDHWTPQNDFYSQVICTQTSLLSSRFLMNPTVQRTSGRLRLKFRWSARNDF